VATITSFVASMICVACCRPHIVALLGLLVLLTMPVVILSNELSPKDYLERGDDALLHGKYEQAIQFYQTGIESLSNHDSIVTLLSLETNLATSLSSLDRSNDAVTHYQRAIAAYSKDIYGVIDEDMAQFAKQITSQAAFFLGMELQDGGEAEEAVDSYRYAVALEPNHWSALANLGSVLHDTLRNHGEALSAYNKAYEILTNDQISPIDPPEEPRFILSQLQYRIGLCLNHNPSRRCALTTDPDKEVSCQEMATHAFSLAVQYDPDNDSAIHMLATVTADATMERASNKYVKTLFDEYAQK
jgi:tetratricopeptide (TPR) repeat protein